MWILAFVIVSVLVLLAYTNKLSEHYSPCSDCDRNVLAGGGTSVLNPFIYPYSATSCVDDIYKLKNKEFNFGAGAMYHQNTPDHVILT